MTFLSRILALLLVVQRIRGGGGRRPQPAAPAQPRDKGRSRRQSSAQFHSASRGASDPDSPLEFEAPDWKETVKRTVRELKDDRATLIAAGMAFYWLLAIFPAVLAAIGILGLIRIDEAVVIDGIRTTLPGGTGDILIRSIARADNPATSSSITAAVLGISLALWSASSGMAALQSGLNVAYEVEDRKFLSKRAIALVLIVIAGLLGAVPSPFFTFGTEWYFTAAGWLLTMVAVVVMFAVFYYLGPNRESPEWRWVTPGGLVGGALWVAVTGGFSWYVDSGLASYGKTYGSIAGVIILVFWLYLTALSVLIGGELNSEVERQKALSERR